MRAETRLRSATPIQPQARHSYQGKLGDGKPFRYYRFQVNQRSSLNVSLSGLKANTSLSLINQTGKTISRAASSKPAKSITQTVDPGTYYVQVRRQQGNTRYQLKIAVDPKTVELALTQPSSSSANSLAEQVVALVNEQRQQAGLKPMRLNSLLTTSAQAHSQDMALNDFFGHTGSNRSTAEDRIYETGYNYATIGENIAAGFATPESVVQAWMNSPSHRQNILHPLLEEMGVGFYFLENDSGETNYRYYWTQDFGQSMS